MNRRFILKLGAATALSNYGSSAIAGSVKIDESAINALVVTRMKQSHIPGFAAGLVVRGGLVWAQGYGYADFASGRKVTPNTLFEMASVSKTIVGTALMYACQEGHLRLDDDVNKYLPFFVRNPRFSDAPITLRHLATHSSSIVDRDDIYLGELNYHFGGDNPIPLASFLSDYLRPGGKYYESGNFSAQRPGRERRYCNIGAALVGYVVERATRTKFADYCRERIFRPLGMRCTGWHMSDVDMSNHVSLYGYPNGQFVPYQFYGLATWPDGGLRTSITELAAFMAMFEETGGGHGTSVLHRSTLQTMLTPQRVAIERDGAPVAHAEQSIFWVIDTTNPQDLLYWHGGSDPGTSTRVMFKPQKRTAVLLFANTDTDDAIKASFQTVGELLFSEGDRLLRKTL